MRFAKAFESEEGSGVHSTPNGEPLSKIVNCSAGVQINYRFCIATYADMRLVVRQTD